ncbi:TetR/AcrR family transcriptional regulator [Acinetobacter sp. 194]|uniref:TetR/AcrR family transcriptional regulator n=1 Tax=Acinetobacter shaoyimingii TaxID=2715164 RepID=UPI00140C8442|nr:TetR/AcrR family transcriptional regulator [Acinetobacter shaoyimingii]NHB58261.1 TetR/AcrR family transcriptional regulator [Acinetobacter shaoyimingii]
MQDNTKPENQAVSSNIHLRRRGRPKCFDENQALEKAMLLFWQYGYEATSISDLTQSLGITAPSLYGTFGDKVELFKKSLDYYLANEACPIDEIFKQAKTAKIAMELYLFENLKRLIQDHKPTGCMLVVSTMNCSITNQQIQTELLNKRLATKQKIFARIQQGVKQGEIPSTTDIQAMTDFYTTMLQGMTIQARDGATMEQLEHVVIMAMKNWDNFLK